MRPYPAHPASPAPDAKSPPWTNARPAFAPSGAPAGRVLVIDDEPLAACLMREMLQGHFECAVDVVPDGVAAFELLARNRYALVVSDLRMPEMNGAELYLWLREAQPATARSFVFVTAYAEERPFDLDLTQWGVPIVPKPFTLDRFLNTCRSYLTTPATPPASLHA
jgi:CheY-like chemotaxis protein